MDTESTMRPASAGVLLGAAMIVVMLTAATQVVTAAPTSSFTVSSSQAVYGSSCAYLDTTKRLYSIGGYIGQTGESDAAKLGVTGGIYSLDLSRNFSTSSPPLTGHGVLDGIDAQHGLVQSVAAVMPDNRIIIAGGRIQPNASVDGDPNPAVYAFDASSSASTKISTSRLKVPMYHALPGSAAVRIDGVKTLLITAGMALTGPFDDVSWVFSVSDTGSITNTSATANAPPGRRLATMHRLNATHHLLSGGSGTGGYHKDLWVFDESKTTWTKSSFTMPMATDHHRIIVYQDRYWIRLGGFTGEENYELITYYDTNTGTAAKGTIVNPGDGPPSIGAGCTHLVGNTIVYLGGRESADDNGHVLGKMASTVNLLAIEPAGSGKSGLQFRWINSYAPPSNASSTTDSKSTSKSPGNGSSTSDGNGSDSSSSSSSSSGVGVGAIIGAVAGTLAAVGLAFLAYRWFATRRIASVPVEAKPNGSVPAPAPEKVMPSHDRAPVIIPAHEIVAAPVIVTESVPAAVLVPKLAAPAEDPLLLPPATPQARPGVAASNVRDSGLVSVNGVGHFMAPGELSMERPTA
ncbi:hypothetical protein AMAG_19796 [Allomyces macrogynus ATCC 38327]|uniref:Kelch repeat protein n=1 Tax=Allomyces macrogynus (strain ATCC 38327) TaxID=578462 RepID=A0A0L0T114_ALLM3|nr:hypothetical protein AMAG_19796 [Allomyces macrogynus ATCC 38327]|eukprot:KNE68350.1 hypothetical protein AMAG_19796 [Allomyces macrogynus ATCC 38327]